MRREKLRMKVAKGLITAAGKIITVARTVAGPVIEVPKYHQRPWSPLDQLISEGVNMRPRGIDLSLTFTFDDDGMFVLLDAANPSRVTALQMHAMMVQATHVVTDRCVATGILKRRETDKPPPDTSGSTTLH